jgi:hypothetical protein
MPCRDDYPAAQGVGALVDLIYELLDAHADTARLVDSDGSAIQWQAHLDYLRGLQRVGRELIAGALADRSAA